MPEIDLLAWSVMAVTLGANVFVAWYEAREGRRLGSGFLVADAAHTRSDVYVSLGVVASFLGIRLVGPLADLVVAVAIAFIVGWAALRVLWRSFNVLTDRYAVEPDHVREIALAVPGVLAVRNVRSRGAAEAIHVDLVVETDGATALHAAHGIADEVEAALKREHPAIVDVVVHLEPAREGRLPHLPSR
jgi:cation diffusion facilitator family transporter